MKRFTASSGLSARFARDLDSGRILLPDGEHDGEEANGSDAPGCDYSGSLDGGIGTLDSPTAGIAFLDDPANQPGCRWFTMADDFGFIAANPTWDTVLTLELNEERSFRWGAWIHPGSPDKSEVKRVYKLFTENSSINM